MPKVEWCASTLPGGSEAMDFQLFYPVCICEDNKEQEKQQYDAECFRQAISLIKEDYKGKVIHILLADTLDRYNRCTSEEVVLMKSANEEQRAVIAERMAHAAEMARADGERWIEQHVPILTELGLRRGVDYIIHRWNEFLTEAEEYLKQFERTLIRQGTIQAFKTTAKHYRKDTMQSYDILPQNEKEIAVKASTSYFVEDYGVTYYIASREQYRPVLFFSKNQNKFVVRNFNKCNKLNLNFDGFDGVVHLRLMHDSERAEPEQMRSNNVISMRNNRSTIFNSKESHAGRCVDQESIKRTAKIQRIRAKLQALNEVRSDLQRINNEQISKVDKQILDCLNELSEEINEQQLQSMSSTILG